MIRLSPAYVVALFTVGAAIVLGLVVFLLEDGGTAPLPERGAIVSRPSGGLSRPLIEELATSATQRDRPATRTPPQPAQRRGPLQIIVHVFDGDTGEPVPSFQATILPHAESDPLTRLDDGVPEAFHRRQGIFRVQKKEGVYDVVVIAPRFLPATLRSVTVPAADGTPLELPLSRGPGIAGTVTADDGLPRQGIDVFLEVLSLRDSTSERPLITKAVTGLDGRFSFSPLPAGDYAVCLLWPNNQDDRIAGIRVRAGTVEVPMQLLARHRVSFRVSNNQGQPLIEAQLEIRGAGHITSAATNAAGIAVVDNLPDGDYRIRVKQPGYHELIEELQLMGGLGHHVHFLRLLSEAEG